MNSHPQVGKKKMVLDASALLALLQDEPGSDQVSRALEDSVISAANLSEVAAKLIQFKVPEEDVLSILASFDFDIVPVDENIALIAGSLIKQTRELGLGLGDRICLATAIANSQTALTADKAWANIAFKDLNVHVIR